MAHGKWHFKGVSTVSVGVPMGPLVTISGSTVVLKISPPDGTLGTDDDSTDIIVQRFGGTAGLSVGLQKGKEGSYTDVFLKKIGLDATPSIAKMGLVKSVVKAVTGSAITNSAPDLLAYFGPSQTATIGVIMPNSARMHSSVATKLFAMPVASLPVAAFEAMDTMRSPSPPLTKETLVEGGMQSLIVSGASGGGLDVGIFYFGLPLAAMGMPWAPWFASAFGVFASAGLAAKFPGAQLGISFWHSGKIVKS